MITSLVRRGVGVRRGIVAAFALAAVGMVAVSVTRDDANVSLPWWLLFTVLMAAWLAARFATGDVAEGRSDRLDERELAIRYRVVRTGYHTVWLTGLAVAVVLLVFDEIPGLANRSGPLLLSAIVAAAAVPTMLLCWAAPEPDPEDD
jgi:hypothetical protein